MAFPAPTTGEARLPARRLRQARARQSAPVDRILGRRDVALVPWLSMLVGALAIALSAWLQGSGSGTNDTVIYCALVGAAIAAGFAAIQDSWLGLRFRGSLWVYILVSISLLAALAALAISQGGLATPAYAGTYLLASYLGLVFPFRWRVAGLVALLGTAVGVQYANPATPAFDAVMTIGLTVAAWVTGAIGSRAHRWAARIADALGSYDQLTNTLNRRGFLAQINGMLDPAHRGGDPIALLIVDLDGFKAVNDQHGHAAGDELLTWVGQTMPTVLPASAELGRLGGDEFAIALPGVTSSGALAVGRAVRGALAERVGASVGVATSETRAVTADDLFRVADAALYMCKRDPELGTHALVAGSAGFVERRRSSRQPDAANRNPLSFARMRASGFRPEVPESGLTYGWMVSQGLAVIAFAGLYVVIGILHEGGGQGLWNDMIRVLGIPWVCSLLALGALARKVDVITGGWRYWTILIGTDFLFGFGVGVAMLAEGGLVAPIGGALAMKIVFMAAIIPQRRAVISLGFMVVTIALVAILGPASALWTLPFSLAMLGSAFALGSIGYRALDDLTTAAMDQAHTDELTGLRNRSGFQEAATDALDAARRSHVPLSLLALDLDDFKAINDSRGHAAGDTVLRDVAAILRDTCPEAKTIGRLGGDEFVVLAPVNSSAVAASLASSVTDATAPTVGASVGYAVFPEDGTDLDALMLAADRRSYARKRQKPHHPMQGRGGHVSEAA